MQTITTLTVKKKAKSKYDNIRDKANKAFIDKYAVPIAFKQVDFFDILIKYIEANEDEFLEFLSNPTDASFWSEWLDMNKIKLFKEIVLLMKDEHVKTTYPLIFATLSQQLAKSGVKVKDLEELKV